MNIALIIALSLISFGTILIVSILVFFLKRKKILQNLTEEANDFIKQTLIVNIKEKTFSIITINQDDEYNPTEVSKRENIPLTRLAISSSSKGRGSFFVDLIEKIISGDNKTKTLTDVRNSIGKSDKMTLSRKKIIFVTVASFDEEERKIYINWNEVNMNIEILTELETEQKLLTEYEAALSLSRECSKIENPILVSIVQSNSYTHISDPAFPPDEIIKILNYYISKKYPTAVTDRHNMYILFDSSNFKKSIENSVKELIDKELKYAKIFSKNLKDKFKALEYSHSLVSKSDEFSMVKNIMTSMTIAKIYYESEEDIVTKYDVTNINDFNEVFKIVNERIKEATNYSLNFDFNYSDDISSGHTVVSTAIPLSVKKFINHYSVGIKEGYIEKILKDSKLINKTEVRKPALLLHWRFVFDILEKRQKSALPIITYTDNDDIDSLSFQILQLLESTHKSKSKISFLMRNISPFYEKIISKGSFKSIVISPQATTNIITNISNELTFEYHKKLASDKKIKIIEFKK